ncbi:MAG: protein kinase [Polyangiaceae bacterium]|nr:protein kinase [Polyangiaceae bacterium]
MADVFLALAPGPNGFNKTVIIKELRGEAPDDRAVAMFLDEARIAARLSHPNIVQIYEVGYHEGGRPFLAMEFVEGQSLQSVARRARREGAPVPVLLRVVSDVLSALDYAHALADYDGTPLELVHRDVTPHNVIVSYEGYGKLLDFGIAKANVRSAQTQGGMIKGKVSYMSPEQASGASVDHRSDLFAVGVMLYQIVTGRRFWGDEQDMPVLVKLASGRLPDIDAGLEGVHAPLAAIVRRALAASPDGRYGSAAEFQADLEGYAAANAALGSRREVSAYMSSIFGAERSALREVLDRRSRAYPAYPRGDSESELPQLHLSGVLQGAGEGSGSLPKTSLTGALVPVPAPASATMPARQGGTALWAVAITALAAVLAIAISGVYVLRKGDSKGTAEAGAPVGKGAAETGAPVGKGAAEAGAPVGKGAAEATAARRGAADAGAGATGKGAADVGAGATGKGAADVGAGSQAANEANANEANGGGANETGAGPGGVGAQPSAARAAATAAPAGLTLTVEAKPAQARLFVDDRPLATNPAAVMVAAGEHRVRAEAEGYAAASQSLTPSGDESVSLTLRPLSKSKQAAPSPPGRGAAAPKPAAPAPREGVSSSAAKGADLAGF